MGLRVHGGPGTGGGIPWVRETQLVHNSPFSQTNCFFVPDLSAFEMGHHLQFVKIAEFFTKKNPHFNDTQGQDRSGWWKWPISERIVSLIVLIVPSSVLRHCHEAHQASHSEIWSSTNLSEPERLKTSMLLSGKN